VKYNPFEPSFLPFCHKLPLLLLWNCLFQVCYHMLELLNWNSI